MKIRIEDEKFVYLQFVWNTDVVIDEHGVTFPGFTLMNAKPVITKTLKNLTVTIEPHIIEDLDPPPNCINCPFGLCLHCPLRINTWGAHSYLDE